ncbi:hypothetical protein Bbelb_040650 [Branchiostoma belcheri]|nr:hypothetical protein Bbelb_040650 [Branchiostoma belcheri]
MPLQTTVIGSYPKPESVPVPDWFRSGPLIRTGQEESYSAQEYNDFQKNVASKEDDSYRELPEAGECSCPDWFRARPGVRTGQEGYSAQEYNDFRRDVASEEAINFRQAGEGLLAAEGKRLTASETSLAPRVEDSLRTDAFSQSGNLAVGSRRGQSSGTPCQGLEAAKRQADAGRQDLEKQITRAIREVIQEQIDIGIDVITDGELRRENYILYFCRQLNGFDFDNLVKETFRNGAWSGYVPAVVSEVGPRDGTPFVLEEWRAAQSLTDRPVKITIPGP